MKCENCRSNEITKQGFRKNKTGKKQKYFCNNCKRSFVIDNGFKKMRFKQETITKAVNKYAKGMSLSKVQKELQKKNIKVSRWTISLWVKKYS